MKKALFLSMLLMLSLFALIIQAANDLKYDIRPAFDKESPAGVYIPQDLEDSLKELKKMLHPSLVEEMKSTPEKNMARYHHGLGTWIRNNWGLWSKSRLALYFDEMGIFHPDDMSGIILDSFWRRLNDKPIDLEEQVRIYKEYWAKTSKKVQK